MIFTFGQFSFQIDGDKKLIDLIPLYWNGYIHENASLKRNIRLFLQERTFHREIILSDGWTLHSDVYKNYVYYVQNRKVLFELQYNFSISDEVIVNVSKPLDSYVRLGIQYGLLLILHKNCIGLHGVTLLCKNEFITLSAPSGTGKTTLSQLLQKYCDALVINGDFALLSLSDEGIMFEPTPFCGTSGRCLNHRVKIDRIVFLRQSKINCWQTLTGRQAMIYFLNNTFIPTWDKDLERIVQQNITRLIAKLRVNSFCFSPVKDAADDFFMYLK